MKITLSLGLLIGFAFAGMVGCTSERSDPVDIFAGMVQPADVNSQITIDFGEKGTNIRIEGESITFLVRNHTEDTFLVMPDHDLLLFQKDGDSWKSVGQQVDYLGATKWVPDKNTEPGAIVLSAVPALTDGGSPVVLRVVVVGTLLDSERTPTQQKVGAYADVTLQP